MKKVRMNIREVFYSEGISFNRNFFAELFLNIVMVYILEPIEENNHHGFIVTTKWRTVLIPIMLFIEIVYQFCSCVWDGGLREFSLQGSLVERHQVWDSAYPEQYKRLKEIYEKKNNA